jgi:uncharacterized repeat protein (TIGR03803 family)
MTRTHFAGLVAAFAATALAAGDAAAGKREEVLYSFQGVPDGNQPLATPIADSHGNLFGTTHLGGTGGCSGGCGAVFELSPGRYGTWSETVLYSFQGGSDGANPESALVMDARGNLYGVTPVGGTGDCSLENLAGCGTVFELKRPAQGRGAWTETVLYSFQGVPGGNGNGDAAEPNTLVFDASGGLLGLTWNGGTCTTQGSETVCDGAAFELKRRYGVWREKVIFRAGASTSTGQGAVLDAAGNLYSSNFGGGPQQAGEVFELSPPASGKGLWSFTDIYDFQNQSDGALPVPGLVFDAAGNLYGASAGSDSVTGNVFELSHANGGWTESVLFSFDNLNVSYYPTQGPIFDAGGNLFGSTSFGGSQGLGDVYKATQTNGAWAAKILYDFGGGSDGSDPQAGLVFGKRGALYGTTLQGGSGNCALGCGTVFRVTP